MNKNDYNEVFERMEDDMIDAGKDIVSPGTLSGTIVNMPKRAKGGTFAPADMELLKRALRYYKDMLVSTVERTKCFSRTHESC